MPLVDVWASIKAKWGDGTPHELKELKISLPEGRVTVELRYSKTEHSDQRLEVQLSDTGAFVPLVGRVSEEIWFTAEEPFFLVSDLYERIYFSRDRETMRDYLSARRDYRVAEENIEKAYKKGQAEARADLKKYEGEYKKLVDALNKRDESWETGGWVGDKISGVTWEKAYEKDALISAARATLSEGLPPVDISYTMAIRTAGLASLSLDKILGAVASTRAELMRTLGVLPKKLTTIPVEPTLNLVVEWRD